MPYAALCSMQTLQIPSYAFWPLSDHLDVSSMCLQFCVFSLLARSRDAALDQTIRVGLRGIYFGILAGVLQTLVPAEIYRHKFD